jgi:hypothetical protein
LETDCRPYVLGILLEAGRGALFPCPDCGAACKAHDFKVSVIKTFGPTERIS